MALAIASLSNIAAVLPVFLVGGLSILIRPDLRFSEAQQGLVVAAFFGASGLSSIPAGRWADRLGAQHSLRLGAIISASVLVGIALVANSWWVLLLLLIPAGAANGIAQTGANLAIARIVPFTRQGLAFGLKQSAIPIATLLAGVAVPAIGLTLGWRGAFAFAALIPLIVMITPLPGGSTARDREKAEDVGLTRSAVVPLAVLACGAAAGSAAAISFGAFTVESSVSAGMSAASAGTVLAVGSAVGIAARVMIGLQADRRQEGHFVTVAVLLGLGAVGFGFLAFGDAHPVLIVVGVTLGFAAGWGWPGLLHFAAVRENTTAPGTASGILLAGGAVGGILGPPLFGALSGVASFRLAWLCASALGLLAALLVLAGDRLQKRRSINTPVEASLGES